MDIHKIDWSAMDWKPIRKGVEQKAFSGSGATVALHRLMPGHEPRPHSHPHEQIAYIIEGRMRFYIGEEAHDLGPNQHSFARYRSFAHSYEAGIPRRAGAGRFVAAVKLPVGNVM